MRACVYIDICIQTQPRMHSKIDLDHDMHKLTRAYNHTLTRGRTYLHTWSIPIARCTPLRPRTENPTSCSRHVVQVPARNAVGAALKRASMGAAVHRAAAVAISFASPAWGLSTGTMACVGLGRIVEVRVCTIGIAVVMGWAVRGSGAGVHHDGRHASFW
jgi:hypothetical protein